MNSVKLTFKNNQEKSLSAKLEYPVDGQPTAYAIFAHCFTCSKNLAAVTNISRALTSKGIAVLRFDFTGLGDSEGDFADTNFSSNVEDLISAATYLEKEHVAPQIIIGHSLGGAAVLMAASKIDSIEAVVTIGAPADPPHVQHLFQGGIDEIEKHGEATVSIGGRPFKIKKQFIEDLRNNSLEFTVGKMRKALLVMHSPQDEIVEVDNARKIYEMAKHPKSFITLDGADHLLTRKEDSMYVGSMVGSWVTRYLALPKTEALETDKQVVVRTGDDGYTTEIKASGHNLIADEPESFGGKNLGPNPYDLLLSSLGACTGMTLRMYADHKKWDLQEVKVHLQHNKVHAKDCDECESNKSKIDKIEKVLEFKGDLSEEQIKRLTEIADKCPVHRTITSEILMNTTVK